MGRISIRKTGLKATPPKYEVEVYPFLKVVCAQCYDHTRVTAGQNVPNRRRIARILTLKGSNTRRIFRGGTHATLNVSVS